jgi:hypothetical protein
MGDIEHRPVATTTLRPWSLATFHTVSFVAAAVAGVHVSGSLRERLAQLDTPTGALAFVALWGLTWLVTSAAIVRMDPPIDAAGSGSIVMSMTVAGGWNGVGIFAALFVVGPLWNLARHSPDLAALPALFFIAVFGSLLAFTVGCTVGMCFGLVDALVLGSGSELFRWTERQREPIVVSLSNHERARPSPGSRRAE